MAFNRIVDFAKAQAETGATWTQWFHKTSIPVGSATTTWNDMSMGAGLPKYNAYVGVQYEATPLIGTGNFGIYHGGDQTDGKVLAEIMLQSNVASLAGSTFILCDYLMFYPLVDMDSTDAQTLDNTATLPRYADGDGVRIIPVVTTPTVGASVGAACSVSYTNQDGVSGRTAVFNPWTTNIGNIPAAASSTNQASTSAPFLVLQGGDTGVRSIESVTNSAGHGGFCSFVLVKPLASISITESTTAVEVNYIKDKFTLPKIENGAYLNFIFGGKTNASGIVRGALTFNWG